MYYTVLFEQEKEFEKLPETGMGYQVIEAYNRLQPYKKERFLVLNSQIVIDWDINAPIYTKRVMQEGITASKQKAQAIYLSQINVLNELTFKGRVNESKDEKERGALENPSENADGNEVFVRLSAFEDDKRIDKINNCLRPGSFTTTMDDYLICKSTKDDPIERYALPNNDEIKHAFHIQPLKIDTLQRGKVQPANGKRGGGKEVYFANGTANGTFKLRTGY